MFERGSLTEIDPGSAQLAPDPPQRRHIIGQFEITLRPTIILRVPSHRLSHIFTLLLAKGQQTLLVVARFCQSTAMRHGDADVVNTKNVYSEVVHVCRHVSYRGRFGLWSYRCWIVVVRMLSLGSAQLGEEGGRRQAKTGFNRNTALNIMDIETVP